MATKVSSKPERAGPRVSDVGEPIGGLGAYLTDRRIAVAQDSSGGRFLIRPDVILVRAPSDEERTRVADVAEEIDVEFSRRGENYVSLGVSVQPVVIGGERRYSVATVAALLERFQDFDASPVHVYTGSNFAGSPFVSSGGVMGNPFVSSGGLSGSPFVSSGGVLGSPFVSSGVEPLNSATPAEPPTTLRKKIGLGSGRRRPQVLVLDTGFAEARFRPSFTALKNALVEHPDWRSEPDHEAADDDDEVDVDGNGRRELQSGHGTFVSGVVSLVCPDAEVHIDGALSSHGIGDDISAGEALERALARTDGDAKHGPIDIVVMSFGGYTENDDPPPLAGFIQDALDARSARSDAAGDEHAVDGLVFVAAAGNNGSPRPTFPAALATVRSVGALGPAGRAYFSNFGGWVDACAPGVDVVSTYFSGYSEKIEPPPELRTLHTHQMPGLDPKGVQLQAVVKKFDGWATWSGTSFSAPKVAAAIANEMFVQRVDAVEAWTRLSHWEKLRYPDLGIVFNIR